MKKFLGILSIFIVLLSGTTIRYSAHYCQGYYIASKLSLTGKDASCGMSDITTHGKDLQLSSLMCVNEISSYTFSDNYVYSPQAPDYGKQIHDIDLPLVIAPVISIVPDSQEFKVPPPGSPTPAGIESEILCVFRI